MSCLFLRHRFVRNFFDYDDSEVIECVPRFPKVFVDRYCVVPFDVIPVFVYSPVSLLGLQFHDILFLVPFVAESEVYCVGRLKSSIRCLISNLFFRDLSVKKLVLTMWVQHFASARPRHGVHLPFDSGFFLTTLLFLIRVFPKMSRKFLLRLKQTSGFSTNFRLSDGLICKIFHVSSRTYLICGRRLS